MMMESDLHVHNVSNNSLHSVRVTTDFPNSSHSTLSSYVLQPTSRTEGDEAEDKLSALPDDILIDIAGRLDDLRSTIRLGALSKRWRHIPRSLPVVKIDVCDICPPSRNNPLAHRYTLDKKLTAHAAATAWLLSPATQTQRTIRKLYLGVYLVDPYLQSVGRAVEDFVAARGGGSLEDLQFTVQPASAAADIDKDGAVFGQRFMSFFDACPVAFKCLTCLDLKKILLQRIGHPCSARRLHTIELVNVPRLEQLKCYQWCGDDLPMRFGYVPCLELVAVSSSCFDWQEPFNLSEWLANCGNLYNLSLDFQDEKIWVKPEGPGQLSRIFSNLRVVSLLNISHDCDFDWTLYVLEAAPSITKFCIKMSWHTCGRNKCEDSADKTNVSWQTSKFQCPNLTLLQIEGFAVEKKAMEYVRLVIKHAPSLKRIRLIKQRPDERCDSIYCQHRSPTRLKFPVRQRENDMIRERLTDGLSSSVKISME
ncbi:hypothetical protein EJB05_32058, partial [Eragrostis curvula]